MLELAKKNRKVSASEKSLEQAASLVKRLYNGLMKNVYSPQMKEVIAHTKTILDLPSLAVQLHSQNGGYIKVSATQGKQFLDDVRSMPIVSLKDVSDHEMLSQYKIFLKKLENETKSTSMTDLEKMDPKVLSKDFFNTNKKLYENNEMVMQAMGVSAIKHSVESVLELFVSVFESHFDARRNIEIWMKIQQWKNLQLW